MRERISVQDIRPGHFVEHIGLTVRRVVIRNGFSGPLAVILHWEDEGATHSTYSPTARLTVDNYVHTGFEAGAL